MFWLKVIRAEENINKTIDVVSTMTLWGMMLWGDDIISYVVSKKGRAGQWKEKLNIES